MTNLMSDQQIENSIGCTFPDREGEHTGIDVELCSLNLLVLNDQVFLCQKFGNDSLDF